MKVFKKVVLYAGYIGACCSCTIYAVLVVLFECQSHYARAWDARMLKYVYRLRTQDVQKSARDKLSVASTENSVSLPTQSKLVAILYPTPKQKKVFVQKKPFTWPIAPDSFWVSSFFGPRKRANGTDGFHTGIDMAALKGTPVRAPRDGVVLQASYVRGYGKMIVIQHNKRFKTRYAHLHSIHVHPGDTIRKGCLIGQVGDTGFIRKEGRDGSHLHFEIYDNETRKDPMKFLPKLV